MKALVLSSGGIDSTTCLTLAIERHGKGNITALSFLYGQKHRKEIEAAEKISKFLGVEHITSDLSNLFLYSDSTLLMHSSKKIPKGSYKTQSKASGENPLSTYVPFRNGLFLSASASIALSKNCRILYYGAHSDDSAGSAYPDCSEKFNHAMNTAIFEGSGHQITVEAPFISVNKAEVIKTGLSLHTPYELTWSCYEGNTEPCGICGTCIDRKKAFEQNGTSDPLSYPAP